MIDLKKHHLDRIDAISAETGSRDVDIVAHMFMELGPEPSDGAITSWLWNECIALGLERRSTFRDGADALEAWLTVDEGSAQPEALTVNDVRNVVECGKPRRSSVKLTWETP